MPGTALERLGQRSWLLRRVLRSPQCRCLAPAAGTPRIRHKRDRRCVGQLTSPAPALQSARSREVGGRDRDAPDEGEAAVRRSGVRRRITRKRPRRRCHRSSRRGAVRSSLPGWRRSGSHDRAPESSASTRSLAENLLTAGRTDARFPRLAPRSPLQVRSACRKQSRDVRCARRACPSSMRSSDARLARRQKGAARPHADVATVARSAPAGVEQPPDVDDHGQPAARHQAALEAVGPGIGRR
jgi:hypothetical protein